MASDLDALVEQIQMIDERELGKKAADAITELRRERDALRHIAMECAAWIAQHRTEGDKLTEAESIKLDKAMCDKANSARAAIDKARKETK